MTTSLIRAIPAKWPCAPFHFHPASHFIIFGFYYFHVILSELKEIFFFSSDLVFLSWFMMKIIDIYIMIILYCSANGTFIPYLQNQNLNSVYYNREESAMLLYARTMLISTYMHLKKVLTMLLHALKYLHCMFVLFRIRKTYFHLLESVKLFPFFAGLLFLAYFRPHTNFRWF